MLAQCKQKWYDAAMATLYVREIPDQLYLQAQKIAAAQGRSLSAYVLTVLEQAVEDEKIRRARSKALANIRRRRRALPIEAPDSVTLLRQIRGENE
jgi:antitoxin FitA